MSATYNYLTGKIEREFKFVKYGTKCKLSGLPTYAGISESDRCLKCRYNEGTIHPWTYRGIYGESIDESYVFCNHPEQKDSKNIEDVKHVFAERLKYEALTVYYD
jgi:hypothetical protein